MKQRVAQFGVARSLGKDGESEAQSIVQQILRKALRMRASAVHIEPRDTSIVIRYRVDGSLRESSPLSKHLLPDIATYVRQLAGLPNTPRRPQEGQCAYTSKHETWNVRVVIAPMLDGEKIVLHIVHQQEPVPDLVSLGFWGETYKDIQHALAQPRGMIVFSSPHSAGKSTTLYACATMLIHPSMHVISIEDQLRFRLPGAQQLEVNPSFGLDAKTAVQIALRQDANAIIVSEIHNQDVFGACLEAAAKHLVCTSLNAQDGATAWRFLLGMGNKHQVESSVTLMVHQRLMRRLCPECRVAVSAQVGAALVAKSGLSPKQFGELLVAFEHEFAHDSPKTNRPQLWQANTEGCKACHFTGYDGQIAVCETIIPGKSPATPLFVDHLVKSAAGLVAAPV